MATNVKDISISKFLLSIGFKPSEKSRPGETWFLSPLRPEERHPSFKVNESKNIWYDFGLGVGGSIIDLVKAYHNFTFLEAVEYLEPRRGVKFAFSRKDSTRPPIEILKTGPLWSKPLISYLAENRKINLHLARPFICEVRYRIGSNTFSAIGFRNDLGGYELRSIYFKGGNSPKYFTTIPGRVECVNLFEGFIDFLSILTFAQKSRPMNQTIVLNSVNNVPRLPDLSQFKEINLYLDNDPAGLAAVKKLQERYPNAINQSAKLFPGHKDANDFLISLSSK
jgi:hypothetical protein